MNKALVWIVGQLICSIGFWTKSKEANLIMLTIFGMTFINLGIIALLTNANLSYAPGGLSGIPLKNQYPDLNEEWYKNIAP